MPLVTPEEIVRKAERAYPKFLKQWICGADAEFFPLRLRASLRRDRKNPKATIAAIERLLAKSKEQRGWGYTVHREHKASLDLGSNRFPQSITVDTLEDLLRLAKQRESFAATREVAQRIRQQLPALEDWLCRNVNQLADLCERCEGLLGVAQYFLDHPWPHCYARQLPVRVDTKFVLRNHAVLRQWLEALQLAGQFPASAIDVNETTFARRFGLRDGQPHRGIRLLDPELSSQVGLPTGELSLPLDAIAKLRVRDATVFIVENNLNLVTMPNFPCGIGIRGEGNASSRLERVGWLRTNRVLYWGDIDVHGFAILSQLRNLFPHVESLLMDLETLERERDYVVNYDGAAPATPTNLTPSERASFEHCLRTNERLEQEKILQPHVEAVFERLHRMEK